MRHQQLAKRRYALLVALAIASLVSGCGQSPSNVPDSGYSVIQDSPDETKSQQLSPFEDVETDIAEAISPALIDSADVSGVAASTPESHPLALAVPVAEAETQPSPAVVVVNKPKIPAANIITGKAVGVTDGDTVTVLDATNTQHKIRLEAIDAPESHQPFGTQSKKALSEKVFGKAVRVEWTEKDKYRRTLGHIYVADRWINREMVEEGWAWHYKQYSDDEDLAKLELTARAKKVGLWADKDAIAPWDFRHDPRLAERVAVRSPAESSIQGVAVYATRTGTKYHRAGCRYLSKSSIPYSLADAQNRYGPCSHCQPPVTKSAVAVSTPLPPVVSPPRTAQPSTETKAVTVYITKSGSKYHTGGCRYLSKSKIPIALDNARGRYGACSVCRPPR
jgi:endonuclease YncB( thermonuclease family)